MAEPAAETSVVSEEKTEPIPPSELEMRMSGSMRMREHDYHLDDKAVVPLDRLQLEEHHHRQNIRLLVRPLTKLHDAQSVSANGDDNCQWLALRAEVASTKEPEHKVLAVTQTSRDIKFSVRIPGENLDGSKRPPLWCELYYDPASDKVVFLNKSEVPILLECSPSRLPHVPPEETRMITPYLASSLKPGSWRIRVYDTPVLDFRILEKRPVTIYQPFPPQIASRNAIQGGSSTSFKRALSPNAHGGDDGERRVKRRASASNEDSKLDDGAVMFLQPGATESGPLVLPLPNTRDADARAAKDEDRTSRELVPANSHALLDTAEGETVDVTGMCELDKYTLTKHKPIASSALSTVYRASHSEVPDQVITVKVLRTRVAPSAADKPMVHERNVIRQADMWLRECQSQDDLDHGSIVKYYGGDARFLSLYMEHVDAQDLTAMPEWRGDPRHVGAAEVDWFQGGRADGLRILCDIAEALAYLHGRHLVHNDIKPANVLYSTARGAVLCDFGLSTPAANPPSGGGTPYYVPPEFIGQNLRGPASDVWALGVTMLYVLRKIQYPDARAHRNHARPLYWQIAAINNPNVNHRRVGNGQSAATQMRDWLVEIFDARKTLDARDTLERVVSEMLDPQPQKRITMAKVVQELGGMPQHRQQQRQRQRRQQQQQQIDQGPA